MCHSSASPADWHFFMRKIGLKMENLCPENWDDAIGDGGPMAVRWATRHDSVFRSPRWGRWHYTEGDWSHTACGSLVVDGGHEMSDAMDKINCRWCKLKWQKKVAWNEQKNTHSNHPARYGNAGISHQGGHGPSAGGARAWCWRGLSGGGQADCAVP